MAQPNLFSFTWSNLTIFGKKICKRLSVWSRKANESPPPGAKESFMEMPLWFANLVFWSVQVALLALTAGVLPRALKLRQPRVLFAYRPSLLATSLLLPFIQPWHRPREAAPMVISADLVGVALPAPSRPAAGHWHLPSLQTIAPLLGIVILVGIALRFA